MSGDELDGIVVPEELRADTALNLWDWLRPQLATAMAAALDQSAGLIQLHPDTWTVPGEDEPAEPDAAAAARYIARLAQLPPPGQLSACHCWCRMSHPRTTGICMAEEARVVRWVHTELAGLVRVPLCQPCADAWPAPAGA